MGECGRFLLERTLLPLLNYTKTKNTLHGKFHNIIITLYFRLPQKWWRSIDEMISNVTFADWDGWEGTTHALSFINFNIPPILSFSFK